MVNATGPKPYDVQWSLGPAAIILMPGELYDLVIGLWAFLRAWLLGSAVPLQTAQSGRRRTRASQSPFRSTSMI
jgi:hypothetical protein